MTRARRKGEGSHRHLSFSNKEPGLKTSSNSLVIGPFGRATKPRKMPVVIYLDQCAASEIAKNPKWRGLRDFLESGVARGSLLCPLPFDTILESSRCGHPETRAEIFSFYRSVSGGWIFRQFFHILADEILALVRPTHRVTGFAYTAKMDRLLEFSAQIGPDFETLRSRRNSILASLVESPGAARFDQVLRDVTREPVARIWRDLRRIASSPNSQSPSEFDCPQIAEFLLDRQITAIEAEELGDKLMHHAMSAIPIQFIHNHLAAAGSHVSAVTQSAPPDGHLIGFKVHHLRM